jgi:DNA-binding response OmpR family regulator
MDGMECTRIIRAQQQANQLRPFIIAQTANVTEEFRKACLDAGMDLFCSKPIDVCDLQTALKRAYNWHHRDDLSALPPPPPATPGVPAPPSLGRRVVHAVDGSSTPPEQPEAAPVVAPEEWKQDEAVVSCVGFGFGPHDHGCMAKA